MGAVTAAAWLHGRSARSCHLCTGTRRHCSPCKHSMLTRSVMQRHAHFATDTIMCIHKVLICRRDEHVHRRGEGSKVTDSSSMKTAPLTKYKHTEWEDTCLVLTWRKGKHSISLVFPDLCTTLRGVQNQSYHFQSDSHASLGEGAQKKCTTAHSSSVWHPTTLPQFSHRMM